MRRTREEGAILLDARSAAAFAQGHIEGAVNLPLPDFTDEALAETLGPDRNRPIYIYCNNNFEGNQTDFASKVALPPPTNPVATQMASQARPVMMALNIPTYINLYGYGYRNIYELDELVNVKDSRIHFEGSLLGKK